VAKFVETFDKLDPEKWAVWRGAGTLNIGEVRDGKFYILTANQALNGYVVLCSVSPYYLANNGVEVEFNVSSGSCGRLTLMIAPYKIRAGIPYFVLKNFDEISFEIDAWERHFIFSRHRRQAILVGVVRRQISDDIYSGKLRISNKNNVTSCYFNGTLISSYRQLENMNVAVFVVALPYADAYAVPRMFEATLDNLTIDEMSTAALSLQWTDLLFTMMAILTLSVFFTIIKKVREIRK